ncbi:50S ribosomal protein L24e [Candidatus Woesearchaeota archaeon]|nr:50S ribosomal protein L24e [Candidatus Woesearchaeota archaeon]
MPKCSFCGKAFPGGTGKLFFKTDGKILYFCKSKCEKNMISLGRNPRNIRWTKASRKERGKE